jgi:hypothetical protein
VALDPEDLNVIKDVGSFTQDIQKSIASDLLPDLKVVGDLSSQFVDNLKNAQSESNLDITGIDNIEKMQQSLVASGRSLEKFKDLTRDFRIEMSTASDQTEALAMLDQQKLEVEHKILDVAGSISKLETEKIPEAAKLVEIESARLSLLNEGTSAYATQKEKLEQSKAELLNLNAGLANNLGVMGSLNKFNDDFIEGQRVSINNMSTMTQYQDDLRTTTGAVFQETNKLLSLNKELNEELQLHGDNMKEFIKTYGGVSDEVMGKFDGLKDSILGSLESIPLIGGMLSKYATGPLEEASGIAKEAFAGALKVGLKHAQDTGSAMGGIQAGLSHFMGNLQGMGAALKSILSGPFLLITAFAALLALSFKRFTELEESARELRKGLGGTLQSTSGIFDEVQRINVEFSHMGVSLDEASASAQALSDKFEPFGLEMMPRTLETAALLSSQIGITNENLAGAAEKFKMLGAGSDATVANLTMAVASASELAGVNADDVMNDIASASEDTLIFMGKTPGALAASAVQARKLGTTVNDIASTMENMLDFESSINKEMKLSSLLGGHVSMHKLRQLSFAGDAEGVAKEQLRLLQQMGGLENMNVFQKRAAAEAMGTSVENLMKMASTEKDRAAFEAKYGDKAIALQEELKKLKEGDTKDAADRMKAQLEEQVQQEKMNRLKNEFNSMMIKLGEKLLPVVEAAMAVLVPVLGEIFEWIGYIMVPFEHLGWLIGKISDGISYVSNLIGDMFGVSEDGASKVKAVIGGIIGYFIFLGPLMGKLIGGIMSLGGKLFEFVGKGIGGMAKSIKDVVTNLSGTVGNLFKNLGKGFKSIFDSIGKSLTSLGKGISGILSGIGKGIGGFLKGLGTGIKGFAQQVGRISLKDSAKAAAALIMLSGAMAVSAIAFKQFAGVSWDDVAKGGTALIALTTALVVMSKTLNSNMKSLMKGVGLLALIGVAIMPAAEAFKMFADIDWENVYMGVGALASFAVVAGLIGAGAKFVALGALAIALLGVSMIPLVYGFQQFTEIPWENVWMGLGAMAAFAATAALIGLGIKFIALGALAIALLGASLIPLAYAFQQFTDIDWNSVFIGVGAMAAFAAVAAIIGLGAPLVIAGSFAIGALGLALIPFGKGLSALIPAFEGFANVFSSMTDSLSKLKLEDVGTLLALAFAVAGLVLLLPAIAGGTIAVGIMAWSIGKLGDAAADAGGPMKLLAEGLDPVINKMLMISEASEKLRNASSVIRDVGGAIASLGAGQMVGEVTGAVGKTAGLFGSIMDKVSDTVTGTNKIEQSKENPLDKIIRLAEALSNMGSVDSTVASIKQALSEFKEFSSVDTASISSAFNAILTPLYKIDDTIVTNITKIGPALSEMIQNILRMNEVGASGMKSFLECISKPETFSVAVEGFDSLTQAVLRFGEALDGLGFIGKLKLLLGMQGATGDIMEQVQSSQPTQGIPKSIVQQSIEKEQSQKLDAVGLAQKGYIFANFVDKIGGEDKLRELQTLRDNKDNTRENYNNFINKNKASALMDQDEFGVEFVKAFSSSELNNEFEKLKSAMINASKATSELQTEMLTSRMEGLRGSTRTLAGNQFNSRLNRSLFDQELIQDRETENQLRQGSPVTTQEMGSIGTGANSNASVIETISSVTNNTQTENTTLADNSGTETKLVELIQLMKSGGIAVHLDGKKVSKRLAEVSNS